MDTLTIWMPDDKHERLKELAEKRGVSVNKLMDELATIALTEHGARSWFEVLVKSGDRERGLAVLDKLDQHLGPNGRGKSEQYVIAAGVEAVVVPAK